MKKLLILIGILFVVMLIIWLAYIKFTTKITFDRDRFYSIKVIGFGSIGLNTEDKIKKNEIVDYLESIRCYHKADREVHNQSPEATVFFNDKDGKIVDRIEFYGDFVEFKGNQYRVIPFMYYGGLEKLCSKLNQQ